MKIPPNADNIAMEHSKELKLKFLQFLKANDAFKKYKQNIIAQSIDKTRLGDVLSILSCEKFIMINSICGQDFQYYQYFTQLINFAFCWVDTPQGQNYWKGLSVRWENEVEAFVLEKDIKV